MAKKILVAIDDSENAVRTVDFVAEHFNRDHDITLFSVIPDVATICSMNSPSLAPYFISEQRILCTLENQKKELVKEILHKAKNDLVEAGFDEKSITVKIKTPDRGIARDIIDEAHSGYGMVVLGRRGLSSIQEFFIGSVSQKVLHGTKGVSVVLVN